MKKAILSTLLVILLTACQSVQPIIGGDAGNGDNSPSGFYFDSTKFIIVDNDGGNRIIPTSMEDMEKRARNLTNDSETQYGAILICEVIGKSINRIIEPSEEDRDESSVYGVNHVLTPVKISRVVFAGKDVFLNEGNEVYLVEPFFYVTKETPAYMEEYGENTIISSEYDPLEKGKRYLMYLSYQPDEIYNFNGETTLRTLGLRESVYCLSDDSPSKRASDDPLYEDIWEEVKKTYDDNK